MNAQENSAVTGGGLGARRRGQGSGLMGRGLKAFSLVGLFFVLTTHGLPLSMVFSAEDVPSIHKIAVVNLDKLFRDFEKTKASDAELEQASKTKQQEREKLVAEIKNMRDELALLNEQARTERQQTIEKKLRQLADFDREAKDSLGKQRDTAVKNILDQIEKAVTSYAKEHGFELVLSERAILYGIDSINITEPILKLLNRSDTKQHS